MNVFTLPENCEYASLKQQTEKHWQRQTHKTTNHFSTINASPQSHLALWENKIINVVWTSEQQLFMMHQ